jgi:hypothetical protein
MRAHRHRLAEPLRVGVLTKNLNWKRYAENGLATEQIFAHSFHNKVDDVVLCFYLCLMYQQNTPILVLDKIALHHNVLM